MRPLPSVAGGESGSTSTSLRVLSALTRATALVAEGLSEERLLPLLARCAAEVASADVAAVYLQPEQPSNGRLVWTLAGHWGADREVLAELPVLYGQGGGILSPLFQNSMVISESDVLNGAAHDAVVSPQFPVRSLAGLPVRRRDRRSVGVLLVGARRAEAFDDDALGMIRAVGQLVGLGIDNVRLAAGQQRERRMVARSAVTLGTVLGSVGSGVCVLELDGTVSVVNKAFQDLFGVGGGLAGVEELKMFAAASVVPRDAAAFHARLRELIADPSQVDESEWELACEPPRIVQRLSAPMRSLVGEVVGRVDIYTDITESRRLYTRLLNSEKLRAIGEMASGVAHDFNNVLASIVGQVELLHADDQPPPTRLALATIRQAALDGARMVRNLQGLARPRVEAPSSAADLTLTVQEAAEMARPRWAGAALHGRRPIDLELNLSAAGGLGRVAIDPAELREVLVNLMYNAADAMPNGGQIEITARPGRTRGAADLVVRDTGQGMPESVRARIFEAFFTTKGAKGSGLGLAVAYSIITRHGGEISVESAQGVGTTFTISLPYAPTAVASPAESRPLAEMAATVAPAAGPARPALAPLRGARILVVDDEPGLVAIVRQFMEISGAIVTVANGGQAALGVLETPGQQFDVVITDLDMPEVDGWAVASSVKARSPRTHVVMLTGWAGEIGPEDVSARGVDIMLGKPCSRAELEAAMARLLSPARPSTFDVLLVDDQPVFARAVSEMLGLQGHRVTTVASAAAALEAIAAQAFEVVVTDYSLGEVSGAELAERIADGPTSPFVVLLTGYATCLDDPSLLSRGVAAVVPKPCSGDDLRQVMARAALSVR
jgi:signal transduction histidine kinase/DNA-binding response OmpR family regulator